MEWSGGIFDFAVPRRRCSPTACNANMYTYVCACTGRYSVKCAADSVKTLGSMSDADFHAASGIDVTSSSDLSLCSAVIEQQLRPILMQSDWEDRKGRFPIHYLFDGMCLDTFLIVSRIEFVVFVFVLVLFLGTFDTRK